MAQLKNQMIPFITKSEIKDMIKRLASEIERDYAGKEVVIICPLKGSVLFVADFMRELKLPQYLDFVHLTSPKNESVRILRDINMDISNKHIIVLEEIVDAARTLTFLIDRLLLSNPASVKVAALLDKPARREISFEPDYVGKTIDDRYVVGYGLDSEEFGRNYANLYTFRQ